MPPNNLPEPGEFTRIFKRMHQSPQSGQDAESEKKIGEISGIFQAADAPAEADSAPAEAVTPPPAAAAPPLPRPTVNTPASPTSNAAEPGEFTQYFQKGLPMRPAQQSGNAPPAPQRSAPSGVQRPSTPIPPPRNLVTDSSGTFTEKFAPKRDSPLHRPDDFGQHSPRMGPAPDLGRPTPSDDIGGFNLRPQTSKRDAPGEYTQLFGHGSLPPAPKQSAVTPAPPPPMMGDSPNNSFPGAEKTLRDIPVTQSTPSGPSEFTLHSGGRPGAPTGDVAGSGAAASGENAAGTRKMPLPNMNVNIAKPTLPMPGMGAQLPGASAHASLAGANVNTPVGSANLNAPVLPPLNAASGMAAAGAAGAKGPKLGDQTKLILFFGVLAILAIVLVVVMVSMQKS